MTQEKPIKDWKFEFMKSLTYELTTVYADHIVTAVQDKNPSIDKQLVKRLRMERGAEHVEEQLEEYRGQKGLGRAKPVSSKQQIRDLNIDRELYFERYINIQGMDQKA